MKKFLFAFFFLFVAPSIALAAPTVTVTSPNGGEVYKQGDMVHITWNSTNASNALVSLGYQSLGQMGYLPSNIASNIPNTGSYDWKVNVGSIVNKTIFKIGVSVGTSQQIIDYSDNYFTVTPYPQITSISPVQITAGIENTITLLGIDFNPTLVVALVGPGADTSVNPTSVGADGKSMAFKFPSTIIIPGTYAVQVLNFGVPIYSSINMTLVATATVPQINAVSYTASVGTFTVSGTNFSSGSKLQYIDTLYPSTTGALTNVVSFSSTQIVFGGNLATLNGASVYKVKIVDAQGNMSNEVTVDTRIVNVVSSAPTINLTAATYNFNNPSFVVNGSNFSSGSKLHYVDTLNSSITGDLTYVVSYSSNQIIFGDNLSTANGASLYKVKIVDAQGNMSNEVTVDTRIVNVVSSAPTINLTATPSQVVYGQPVTFFWSSTNATECSLRNGVGLTAGNSDRFKANDSTQNVPYSTQNYTLTCSGTGGSTTKTVTVTVAESFSGCTTAFDPATGQACPVQATPALGCFSGYKFNSLTGKPCVTTTVTTSSAVSTPGLTDQFTPVASTQNSCVNLQNNMGYRSRDVSTNSEVSDLQDFLVTNGYLSVEPTGYFGLMTVASVKKFQSAVGIGSATTPGYGGVGPKSRAKIKSMTCSVGQ